MKDYKNILAATGLTFLLSGNLFAQFTNPTTAPGSIGLTNTSNYVDLRSNYSVSSANSIPKLTVGVKAMNDAGYNKGIGARFKIYSNSFNPVPVTAEGIHFGIDLATYGSNNTEYYFRTYKFNGTNEVPHVALQTNGVLTGLKSLNWSGSELKDDQGGSLEIGGDGGGFPYIDFHGPDKTISPDYTVRLQNEYKRTLKLDGKLLLGSNNASTDNENYKLFVESGIYLSTPGTATIWMDKKGTANKQEFVFANNGAPKWTLGTGLSNTNINDFFLYNISLNKSVMYFQEDGRLGINTQNVPAGYQMGVYGGIYTTKLKISTTGWADFVFDPSYKLKPLSEVESFIKSNHHLPEIPSEAEVKAEGIDLADINSKLLMKVEELTLYIIEQNKQLELQTKTNKEQGQLLQLLKSDLEALKNQK
jgi:hypothetical protein